MFRLINVTVHENFRQRQPKLCNKFVPVATSQKTYSYYILCAVLIVDAETKF